MVRNNILAFSGRVGLEREIRVLSQVEYSSPAVVNRKAGKKMPGFLLVQTMKARTTSIFYIGNLHLPAFFDEYTLTVYALAQADSGIDG